MAEPPYLLFVGEGEQRQPLEELAREMRLEGVRFLDSRIRLNCRLITTFATSSSCPRWRSPGGWWSTKR